MIEFVSFVFKVKCKGIILFVCIFRGLQYCQIKTKLFNMLTEEAQKLIRAYIVADLKHELDLFDKV